MANELTLNFDLNFIKKGVTSIAMASGPFQVSVLGVQSIRNVITATLTSKALVLNEGTPGYCIMRNAENSSNQLTHFISIFAGSSAPLIMLRPGEWAMFRLDPNAAPHIQMNPALTNPSDPTGIPLEYLIIAD